LLRHVGIQRTNLRQARQERYRGIGGPTCIKATSLRYILRSREMTELVVGNQIESLYEDVAAPV
jgi:hypothetical protein